MANPEHVEIVKRRKDAIDEKWKDYEREKVIMRRVKKKNILDFSSWKTKKFNEQFDKLMRGMKLNYEVPGGETDGGDA